MSDALFVYGSLCFDEVLLQLLGRVPAQTPWSVDGWRVARLRHRPYPGLVAAPAGRARGTVLRDLTPEDWRTLDVYEGAQYQRRPLGQLDGDDVHTYVWLDDDLVEPADWDREDFGRRLLPEYVAALSTTQT